MTVRLGGLAHLDPVLRGVTACGLPFIQSDRERARPIDCTGCRQWRHAMRNGRLSIWTPAAFRGAR
jgi:hypothetical protein